MKSRLIVVLSLAALASACSPPASDPAGETKAAATKAAAAETSCSDTEKLPVTGLCPQQALALLDPTSLKPADGLPEGCMWTVSETPMGADGEALLYQALRCNGRTTRLELRAGARSASLGYGTSGFYDMVPEGFEPVRIFTTDGQADPKAAILAMAKETTEDKAEAAACEIKPYSEPGLPPEAGAFVINVSDAWMRENPLPAVAEGDMPDTWMACGPYGAMDGLRYWFIRQGYAWMIEFGQDTPDFNPNSFMRVVRGADGVWAPMP